jgi:hypothetical protein
MQIVPGALVATSPEVVNDAMSLTHVTLLLILFVCRGLGGVRRARAAAMIAAGAGRCTLSGCALLADKPGPGRLASALRKERPFLQDATDDDQHDGVYWPTDLFNTDARSCNAALRMESKTSAVAVSAAACTSVASIVAAAAKNADATSTRTTNHPRSL